MCRPTVEYFCTVDKYESLQHGREVPAKSGVCRKMRKERKKGISKTSVDHSVNQTKHKQELLKTVDSEVMQLYYIHVAFIFL